MPLLSCLADNPSEMTRGIYAGATGMYAQQLALDVIAGNLANASSTAYKSDRISFREVLDREVYVPDGSGSRYVGRLGMGALPEGRTVVNVQGALIPTRNPLDVAIDGDGFFSVVTPFGVRYTRVGSFQVSPNGKLTTREGYQVLGSKGPIALTPGVRPSIDPSGAVLVGNTIVDRLAVVTGDLQKAGNGLYSGTARALSNPRLIPGHLEASNVDLASEMVRMIETIRSFEANQRLVQAQDETLQKAVNDLARVA